jgi:hypothetical protein
MSSTSKNALGLLITALLSLLMFFLLKGFPFPLPITVLVAIFTGVFLSLLFLPTSFQAWISAQFSRVPVIVFGSWLGMALTMGSMTWAVVNMQQDVQSMKSDMNLMATDMHSMSADMSAMRLSIAEMHDDIEQIDDVILGIDQTLESEIGPSVRIMAPAVANMGNSMQRGVNSFSSPMDYMKNAF